MRIAHYVPNMYSPGGIAAYVRRAGRAQTRAGHEVCYLGDDAPESEEPAPYRRVANAEDLFATAAALEVDVLHTHKPVDAVVESSVTVVRTVHGNLASCPSGTRFHARSGRACDRAYSVAGCLWGHYVDRCGSRDPRNVWGDFKQIRHQRELIPGMPTYTVSRFLREQMIRAGYPAERLEVIYSPAPTPPDAYEPPPAGTPRILFLGRIVPQKGVDWLLQAAARATAEFHLDVAGEGYKRKEVEALAYELGIEDRVTFHGWAGPDDFERLLVASRAVVFPSRWHEPAGLVSLEAAAFGRAVVASRVGGIPEYAADDFAVLVEPNDTKALARAIDDLAADRSLAERLGRGGRIAAQTRFRMGDFVERLDGFYRRALRSGPARKRRARLPAGRPVG